MSLPPLRRGSLQWRLVEFTDEELALELRHRRDARPPRRPILPNPGREEPSIPMRYYWAFVTVMFGLVAYGLIARFG